MTEIIVQTLRIPKDTRALISRVCENRSETMSTFIRRAILKELASLSYLDDDQKKSLGIKNDTEPTTPGEGSTDHDQRNG